MSQQETVKVYELAKELGIDSISLLDKLKDLNINVKNHMSELGNEELRMARSSLKRLAAGHSSSTKKSGATTRTRKKATSTETAAASTLPPSAETQPPEKKASSPVIRRRVKSDGVTEVVNSAGARSLQQADHPSSVEITGSDDQSVAGIEYGETSLEEVKLTPSPPELETQPLGATSAATKQEVFSTVESKSGGSAFQTSTQPTAPAKPSRPPVILPPRPVAPRRSILKIVEASAPPPRPFIKPAVPSATGSQRPIPSKGIGGATDKEGFRIIKMTKENLDQMAEEEAAKKRGLGVRDREHELSPEDVRFADYRKKEMVFLPKKKKIPIGKEIKKTQLTTAKAQKRIVEMRESIRVQDFANQLSVKASDVIRKLMNMGQMVTLNESIDFDTASLLASEYQYEVKNIAFNEEAILGVTEDSSESLEPRPPVVTIMGHVDHGKTTLLDAIRETNVAGGEAGGITQHIGAYTVEKNGKLITFIDTPGHEAFTVMRARGANVTDIVILVVAADDGVMPQTREALSHAQAAKVPIVVAVNKIDKPGANPEKLKQSLAELNLLAEDWGGDTMFVPVSALKKTNLDKLLDAILLQAEVLDLKANPSARGAGTILEARLEKGRGPVVSVLVNRGTLHVGDPIVSGQFAGKIKAMMDDKGRTVEEAGPGFAVEILGFEGLPGAGEKFHTVESESDARNVAENRVDKTRERISASQGGRIKLEDLFSRIQAGDIKELNIVLKTDVFGSCEAIRDSLVKNATEKVKVKVIHAAPGGITESDVLLAGASNAIIVGFNVRPETKARQVAEAEHVEIKCYNIIYELLDDVKKAMEGLLEKKKVERFLGRAEVRQTFQVPKIGTIAGTSVIDGKIVRGANVRLLRDSRVVFEGRMSSLRRFKDDAKEVATGFECGIGIENYQDLKPGDIIEAFQIDMVASTLAD